MLGKYSVFDGEAFGEPFKLGDTCYRGRVTAIEQTLLIRFKYEDYQALFFKESGIQEKLELLRLIFKLELTRDQLKDEDLQTICHSLQPHKFPSKTLIFRQGEQYPDLILVGGGKISAINQYILKKQKQLPKDIKKLQKTIYPQKQNQLSNPIFPQQQQHQRSHHHHNNWMDVGSGSNQDGEVESVWRSCLRGKIRRENLINYEVLKQNWRTIWYYFMKQQATYIKGDLLNFPTLLLQQPSPCSCSSSPSSPVVPHYSLMSNSNDTIIYTIPKTSYNYFPNHIKKILQERAKQLQSKGVKVQSAKDVRLWNQFKEKICAGIIRDKKDRYQRNWG